MTEPTPTAGDLFGESVSGNSSRVVVGAPGDDSATGAAYMYSAASGGLVEMAELQGADTGQNAEFGESVSSPTGTNQTKLLIGAPGQNDSTGVAYVFSVTAGSSSQIAELTASDSTAGDRFGQAVYNNAITTIGAPGKNSSAGAAYIFQGLTQKTELTASDAEPGNQFGYSVSNTSHNIVVGSPTGAPSGSAYKFADGSGPWVQHSIFTPSGATTYP